MPLKLKPSFTLDMETIGATQKEQSNMGMNDITLTPSEKITIIKKPFDLQKIPDNFGKNDVSMKKIKQKFTKNQSGKEFGVRLEFYKNTDESKFTKIFTYDKEDSNIIEDKILQEVYYHEMFYNSRKTCDFMIPELIQYGNLDTNHSWESSFYIQMEFIQSDMFKKSMQSNNCKNLEEKVKTINKCLEERNLYHNDLHHENILVDKNNNIIIIDFGEASNTPVNFNEISLCNKTGGKCKTRTKRKTNKKRIVQRKTNKKRINRRRQTIKHK